MEIDKDVQMQSNCHVDKSHIDRDNEQNNPDEVSSDISGRHSVYSPLSFITKSTLFTSSWCIIFSFGYVC